MLMMLVLEMLRVTVGGVMIKLAWGVESSSESDGDIGSGADRDDDINGDDSNSGGESGDGGIET